MEPFAFYPRSLFLALIVIYILSCRASKSSFFNEGSLLHEEGSREIEETIEIRIIAKKGNEKEVESLRVFHQVSKFGGNFQPRLGQIELKILFEILIRRQVASIQGSGFHPRRYSRMELIRNWIEYLIDPTGITSLGRGYNSQIIILYLKLYNIKTKN